MLLSDSTIGDLIATGQLGLTPYDPELLQPASVDIRLDRHFEVFTPGQTVDPAARPVFAASLPRTIGAGQRLVLPGGEFVLGSSVEEVRLPAWLACRVEGKSGLGRLGLMVHSTAGWIDPGFTGHITLELANVRRDPIVLYPGMRIGQLAFMRLDVPARTPYGGGKLGSHYQGQARGPQTSRSWDGFRTWDVP